jgi:transcriptional regulator GlxA family with amidase domain
MRNSILLPLLLMFSMPALAATPQGPPAAAAPPAATAAPQETQRTVVVLIYDGVELGDFAAPVEVFKVASELGPSTTPSFQIRLAAEKPGPVQVEGGIVVQADCVLAECPKPDILVLAGGRGALEGIKRPALIEWIRQQSSVADTVMTICLGNFLLAKAGLLDGVPVTIHKQGAGYLKYLAPKAKIESGRYLRSGKIVTTAGFASSIDASLEVVAKYLGMERAQATAEWLDHSWKPAAAAAAP